MKLWMNAKHECAQIYNTAMRTCVRGGANEFNFSKKKKSFMEQTIYYYRYVLYFASFCFLLRNILFNGIIKNGFYTKLPQPIQDRSDLHLVFAGDKVTVKCSLHKLREKFLAKYLLG